MTLIADLSGQNESELIGCLEECVRHEDDRLCLTGLGVDKMNEGVN